MPEPRRLPICSYCGYSPARWSLVRLAHQCGECGEPIAREAGPLAA